MSAKSRGRYMHARKAHSPSVSLKSILLDHLGSRSDSLGTVRRRLSRISESRRGLDAPYIQSRYEIPSVPLSPGDSSTIIRLPDHLTPSAISTARWRQWILIPRGFKSVWKIALRVNEALLWRADVISCEEIVSCRIRSRSFKKPGEGGFNRLLPGLRRNKLASRSVLLPRTENADWFQTFCKRSGNIPRKGE